MSRHISPNAFYDLPSGTRVHPCRLIQKDGTLMWKHAFLNFNTFTELPSEQAHEQHIIKTAQRIEELNSWVSQDLDPWEFLKPSAWYFPGDKELNEGIALFFKHTSLPNSYVYSVLERHINEYETLEIKGKHLYFRRC